jgi:hypothetical protein
MYVISVIYVFQRRALLTSINAFTLDGNVSDAKLVVKLSDCKRILQDIAEHAMEINVSDVNFAIKGFYANII